MLTKLIILAIGFYASIASAHQAIDVQVERLNALLKAAPNDRVLLVKRGELHRQHRDWDLALKDYLQAKKIKNTSGDIDFYIGRLWVDMEQAKRALPLLRRFTLSNPRHSVALQYQGDAHFALKQFFRAALVYEQASVFEKHPDPELFLKIANAYTAAGSDYQKDAKAAIEQGMVRLGPLVTLITTGIEFELKQQHYNQALALLERLPEVVKNSPKWLARRGDILQKSGRKEEAILAYNRVISRIENLPLSRRNTREMSQIINSLNLKQYQP